VIEVQGGLSEVSPRFNYLIYILTILSPTFGFKLH
jgi:hypothetical protein